MVLKTYGWSEFFASHFESQRATSSRDSLEPGRVVLDRRERLSVVTEKGEVEATVAGRLRRSRDSAERPVVGDWIALRRLHASEGVIEAVFPRRTKLSRKVAGARTDEQVAAANVDTVFLVMGLDGDYNLRRLERLLATAWESGARPVVVLSKADLCERVEERLAEVGRVALGVEVLALSSLREEGLEALGPYLREGETVALIGSSGVGKSTLINRLCGHEVLRTGAVREDDDRGRHTTTHRQLVRLPEGGLLIDNPGIREIQLWVSDAGLASAFGEIEALASDCRFRDCTHSGEPGCAVHAAVERGEVAEERLDHLHTLRKELRYLELRRDEHAQRQEKKRVAAIHKAVQRQKKRW